MRMPKKVPKDFFQRAKMIANMEAGTVTYKYMSGKAHLHIRNIPVSLMLGFKTLAAKENVTMRALIIELMNQRVSEMKKLGIQ